jgi:hypothetical protein
VRGEPPLSYALGLTLLAVVLSLVACSNSEADIAGKHEVVSQVSPGALPALPQGIEGTTLTITDARFETEQLVLQVNQLTVLLVVNHGNRAYRLRIDQLVDGQPIAAATTTRSGFTTRVTSSKPPTIRRLLRYGWSSKHPVERHIARAD